MKCLGEMKLQPFGRDFPFKSDVRREFICELTADDARRLLENVHPDNRKSTQKYVDEHLRNIESNLFHQPSEPGVYLDRVGRTCNACHRLRAQVKSGQTLKWRIVVGASQEEIRALDQNRKRTKTQSYNLTMNGRKMTPREEAVINQFMRLEESSGTLTHCHKSLSMEDLIAARELYGEDIWWAMGELPKKSGPAPLVAAVAFARAIDPDAMSRFATTYFNARTLEPGDYKKGDPPFTLAKFMLEFRGAGGQFVDEVMLKTLSACRAALSGKTLLRLQIGPEALAWVKNQRIASLGE